MRPLPDNWLETFEPLPQLPESMERMPILPLNPADWPSVEEQRAYWDTKADKQFERPIDDASADWFDEQEEYWSLRDDGRSDGQGESYSERNT